jgi:predicted AAA+ superfamily ATPase
MNDKFINAYHAVRDELVRRLRESAPGYIQLLTGPRQVGKTTLLLELTKEFRGKAIYASADSSEGQLSGWWEALCCRAREMAVQQGVAYLFVDEIPYLPDWGRRLKSEADRIRKDRVPLHLVVSGSSAIQLGAGSRETMAGRFERLRLLHWPSVELERCFNLSAREAALQFVRTGSYPGAQRFLEQPDRWRAYLHDSIIEPAVGQDILNLELVRKPGLLRQLYSVSIGHPAEIVSLQKLTGQLSEKGAMDTVAHYLHLLEEACLVAGVRKYSDREIRQRASPPKLLVLNNALMAAAGTGPSPEKDPVRWGRWVENACGATAWNAGQAVYYWRAEPQEVDWVIDGSWGAWAVEVKTGMYRVNELQGLLEFCRRHTKFKPLLLCDEGEEGVASNAGIEVQNWMSFLCDGPPGGGRDLQGDCGGRGR